MNPRLDGFAHTGGQRDLSLADLGKVASPRALLQADSSCLKERFGDLHQKEGVSLRLRVQSARQGHRGVAHSGHLHHHRLHGCGREVRQPQRPGQPFPGQSPPQGQQGMLQADLFGAEGAYQENRMVGQIAGQVVQQFQCGFAGPMQVLQDEEECFLRGQASQEMGHTLEEACPLLIQGRLGLGIPLQHLWHQAGDLSQGPVGQVHQFASGQGGQNGAHRLGDRLVGQGALELVAASPQHTGAPPAQTVSELLHQAGLAHPGLATDEHQATVSCLCSSPAVV